MGPKTSIIIFCIFLSSLLYGQELPLNYSAKRAYALDSLMRSDETKIVGSFSPDTSAKLPIGLKKQIGETSYIIAVDSAYFLPDGAYFSAYMALKFPGAKQKIAFAAKNVRFNPKGVVGGELASLQLATDMFIDLGPNITMHLPADGTNKIQWGCNGYESCDLKGRFIFSKKLIEPVNGDTAAYAEFAVHFEDVNNLMMGITMSPFSMKGMKDYVFSVSEAYADMSDYSNPAGCVLPACYAEIYPGSPNLFRGFYMKSFSVDLPNSLSKGETGTTIYGNNLFIDNAGVTGQFGATNLLNTNDGKTDGKWAFSVSHLEVGLTTNKLTSGEMSGEILVPPMDDNPLEYNALIALNEVTKETDYNFVVSPSEDVSFSAASAKVDLYATTRIEMNKSLEGKFVPKLIANGKISVDNEDGKFPGIGFQNLILLAKAPHIGGGVFSLIGAEQSKAAKYPVSITNIGMGVYNQKPVFKADVALNLGDSTSANSFSAATGVKVHCAIENVGGKNKWRYDKTTINDILLEVNTTPFYMGGLVSYKNDDPVYGKGFIGSMAFRIKPIMESNATFACAFGKLPTYKYWMVEAKIPTNINVGATTKIKALMGGLSFKMRDNRSTSQLLNAISGGTVPAGEPTLSFAYVPDATMGLGFKAGVAMDHVKEDVLNSDMVLSLQLNENGGIHEILFAGQAYQLCTREKRNSAPSYVKGGVEILYDNEEKILDADISANANFNNALTASIYAKLYFSPGLWYVHLGTPSLPCSANLLNLASANAYFMLGQDLPPMPPAPPQVSSVLGGLGNQRNTGSIANGNGIAMGVNMNAAFGGDVLIFNDKWRLYGAGSAGMGFDMTLYKYAETTHCSGYPGEEFGANYWFLNGQLYAYAGLTAGVERMSDNSTYDIFSGSFAALLEGKLPNPSYVYGGVNLQISVLGVLNVTHTFDFDFGTDCEVVND